MPRPQKGSREAHERAMKAAETRRRNAALRPRAREEVAPVRKRDANTRPRQSAKARVPHERSVRRESYTAAKHILSGKSWQTITDPAGNTVQIERQDNTPKARALRYPAVRLLYSRILQNETDTARLRNKAAQQHLSDREYTHLKELRAQHHQLVVDFDARYKTALAHEKKRATQEKRNTPPALKPKTRRRRKRTMNSEQKAASDLLLQRQREWEQASKEYEQQPTARHLSRLKAARARYWAQNERVSGVSYGGRTRSPGRIRGH